MRKILGLLIAAVTVASSMVFSALPAMAKTEVKTSIIGGGTYKDDGKGGGVYAILLIIMNVMMILVGVLGVLGIVISGIQYLTAADNEQQMVKAKQRILNVVIGLALYAMLWSVMQWLVPGGIFGTGD